MSFNQRNAIPPICFFIYLGYVCYCFKDKDTTCEIKINVQFTHCVDNSCSVYLWSLFRAILDIVVLLFDSVQVLFRQQKNRIKFNLYGFLIFDFQLLQFKQFSLSDIFPVLLQVKQFLPFFFLPFVLTTHSDIRVSPQYN